MFGRRKVLESGPESALPWAPVKMIFVILKVPLTLSGNHFGTLLQFCQTRQTLRAPKTKDNEIRKDTPKT